MKFLNDYKTIDDVISQSFYKKYEESYLSKPNSYSITEKHLLKIEKEFEDMITDKTKEIVNQYNKSKY